MNVEEYCIENNKQELFNNFMLDIDPAPWKNMGGAESAMHTQYNNKKLLFNYKCHICTTEWEGSVYSYIVEQLGCPKCNDNSNPVKIKYASRKQGSITLDEYCDDHGDWGQRLRAEFDDENNELTREEAFLLSYGSQTELNWKCLEYGHQWSSRVSNRVSKETICPYCSGNKTSELNSLSTWCSKNGKRGQQIAKSWVGIDEDGNAISMEEVSKASTKPVKWKCDLCNSVWTMSISQRTYKNNDCPYCRGLRVNHTNSLLTYCEQNGAWGQRLKAEWTSLDKDGNTISMEEVTKSSHKEVQWECQECGHKWVTTINHRTSANNRRGCPFCAGRQVCTENSLLTYCEQNGEWGQQLIDEWTGLDSEGNIIEMDKVTKMSSKKPLWRCKNGHIWPATIANRTANKTFCPYCNTRSTSYPEQFIYWSLSQLYPDTENRYLTFQSEQNPKGIEYDIAIPELPLYIEYSPTYWHNSKKEIDKNKKELCEQHDIRFIQIIEDSNNELEHIFTENYICIPKLRHNRDDYLIKIVSYILNSINHNINEIDIETVKNNALKYSTGSIEYEKSVEFLFPTLAAEWHESNIIKPSEVTPGSASRIKFLCPNCSYKWEVDIHNRVNHQSGCPRCGYNWYKAHTGQPQKIKPQYRKFQEQKFDINTLTSSKSKSEWTEEEDLDI